MGCRVRVGRAEGRVVPGVLGRPGWWCCETALLDIDMFWSVGVREVPCDVTGGVRAGERAVCTALPRCYTVVWAIKVVASERTSSREPAAYRSPPRSHHSALHVMSCLRPSTGPYRWKRSPSGVTTDWNFITLSLL